MFRMMSGDRIKNLEISISIYTECITIQSGNSLLWPCSRITMTDVLTVDEVAARMHDLRTEITDEVGIKRDSYWLEV